MTMMADKLTALVSAHNYFSERGNGELVSLIEEAITKQISGFISRLDNLDNEQAPPSDQTG